MSTHKYATPLEGARAVGRFLPISPRHSVEVCNFVRGMNLILAKKLLKEVADGKRPIPYHRHTLDLGHKKGMAAGRTPRRTAEEILALIESVEVNAQFKGMNTAQLKIQHIVAQRAGKQFHTGRHRGRTKKSAHVEIVVTEEKKGSGKESDKK